MTTVITAFTYIVGPYFTDVTFLLIMNERILDGERMYIDVRDINPPFSVWLYFPYAALEKLTGFSAYIWLGLGLSAWLTLSLLFINLLMRDGLQISQSDRKRFLPFMAIFCVFLMPSQVAQREHFCGLAALPFFFLLSARIKYHYQPKLWLAVSIGALAGTLLILKPHYALGFGLPIMYVAWRRQNWRYLFLLEAWMIAVMVIGYWLVAYISVPAFFEHIVPIALDTYQVRVRKLPIDLISYFLLFLVPALLLVWLLRILGVIPVTVQVLAIASFGFSIAYLVQGKGWSYHMMPALLCLVAAYFYAFQIAASPDVGNSKLARLKRFSYAFVLYIWPATTIVVFPAIPPSAVVEFKANPSILFITSNIGVSAPIVKALDAKWVDRDPSDIIASNALYAASSQSPQHGEKLNRFVAYWIDFKLHLLETTQPDLIVFDWDDETWVPRILSEERFINALQNYQKLAQAGDVTYYVRSDLVEDAPTN